MSMSETGDPIDRAKVARAIQLLIDYLDAEDAPFEDLEDEPDGCLVEDQSPGGPDTWLPGDPDDSEDGHDMELTAGERYGCGYAVVGRHDDDEDTHDREWCCEDEGAQVDAEPGPPWLGRTDLYGGGCTDE